MLGSLPALAEAQQVPVRCHDPLSEDQLTEMVKHSVPALPIQRNIAKCGIDFNATDEVIGRLRSAGAPETVLAAVRVATGPLERKRRADQALWDSVKDSQDPAKYEDYLRRYPAGQYAALARQKYRQLTAPMPSAQDLDEIARRADAAFAQKDYATAAPLYRQLADSGRAAAMTILGWMYTIGQGETQDDAQAIAWYRKGAEGGNREAMTQLGFMYQNGRGVAQDDSQAVDWYRKAAEKGEPMGMTALGFMYEKGRGVARDNSLAVDWYRKAAALGNEAAKASLKRLSEIAPPPDYATAAPKQVNPNDGMTYVWIPPGTFLMGCSPGDGECTDAERPAHEVTITRGFWLGQTPVTQQAYQRVTGQNPSNLKGANLPVENVNWDEAQAYCAAIGGRLPTEAEWEYAARAGSTAARYGNLDEIAWHSGNSGGRTHEVGQKLANAFGLFDMLGDVWQWTANWYGNYPSGAQSDPSGPESGESRALRGGSWVSTPRFARVSYRRKYDPGIRLDVIGLRCVEE